MTKRISDLLDLDAMMRDTPTQQVIIIRRDEPMPEIVIEPNHSPSGPVKKRGKGKHKRY